MRLLDTKTPIPTTQFVPTRFSADGKPYMEGASEVDHWALLNDPTWRHASLMAEWHGLGELERMRLIAHFMLAECYRVKESVRKDMEAVSVPNPVTGSNGEVWRYVGP